MKHAWKRIWSVLRWPVAAFLVLYALDEAQNPGSRAVAAIVLLGWYVHLQIVKLQARQDALADQLHAKGDAP